MCVCVLALTGTVFEESVTLVSLSLIFPLWHYDSDVVLSKPRSPTVFSKGLLLYRGCCSLASHFETFRSKASSWQRCLYLRHRVSETRTAESSVCTSGLGPLFSFLIVFVLNKQRARALRFLFFSSAQEQRNESDPNKLDQSEYKHTVET